MKQYATLITTLPDDRSERAKQLGRYSAQGWQLVAVERHENGEREAYFQREVGGEALFSDKETT